MVYRFCFLENSKLGVCLKLRGFVKIFGYWDIIIIFIVELMYLKYCGDWDFRVL